jgi:hypothetical protein
VEHCGDIDLPSIIEVRAVGHQDANAEGNLRPTHNRPSVGKVRWIQDDQGGQGRCHVRRERWPAQSQRHDQPVSLKRMRRAPSRHWTSLHLLSNVLAHGRHDRLTHLDSNSFLIDKCTSSPNLSSNPSPSAPLQLGPASSYLGHRHPANHFITPPTSLVGSQIQYSRMKSKLRFSPCCRHCIWLSSEQRIHLARLPWLCQLTLTTVEKLKRTKVLHAGTNYTPSKALEVLVGG